MSDEPASEAPPGARSGFAIVPRVRDRVRAQLRRLVAALRLRRRRRRARADRDRAASWNRWSVGPSTCPRPELVLAELATLLPPERLSTRLRALTGAPAGRARSISACRFRSSWRGRVREYRDEARDCTHRARVAAVFVALTIDPASIAAAPPAPRRRRRRRPASARSPRPRRRRPPARARRGGAPSTRASAPRSRRAGRTARCGWRSGAAARVRRRARSRCGRSTPASAACACTSGGCPSTPASARVSRKAASHRTPSWACAPRCCPRRALDLAAANSRTTIELGVRGALGVSRRCVALRAVRGAARRAGSHPAGDLRAAAGCCRPHAVSLDRRQRGRLAGVPAMTARASPVPFAFAALAALAGGCGPRLDVGSDVLWTGAVRRRHLRRMDGRRRRRRAGVSRCRRTSSRCRPSAFAAAATRRS